MLFKRFLLLSLLVTPLAGWGAADVSGPSSSLDRSIPTFSGTTGKVLQDNSLSPTNNVFISAYGDIYWPAGFGFLYLHSMSSTQRDSRGPGDGMIFFNSTLGLPQYYANGAWHTWIDDGAVPANMFYAGPYQPSGTNGTGQAVFRYIQPNDIGGTDVMYVPQGTGFPRIINHGEQATASLILENDISLADNTTNNVSTNAHGFMIKGNNDSTAFLNGKLGWSVPPGGGGSNNWVNSGTTNSILAGNASAQNGYFTNSLGVGTNNFTGGVMASFLGPIRTEGTLGGYVFSDRTSGTNWVWYGSSTIARLYNGLVDIFSSDINGNASVRGSLSSDSLVGTNTLVVPRGTFSNVRYNEGNLGSVSGGGTATLSHNTNVYYLTAGGGTFNIDLPATPGTGEWLEVNVTNTTGGIQVGTIKVGGVTTALITPWGTSSSVTNGIGADAQYMFKAINGVWRYFNSVGDAYNPAGSGTGDLTDVLAGNGVVVTNSTGPSPIVGLNIAAGSNITLTTNGSGQITFASSGGSGDLTDVVAGNGIVITNGTGPAPIVGLNIVAGTNMTFTTNSGQITINSSGSGGSGTNASTITVTTGTDATSFPAFFDSQTGDLVPHTTGSFTFDPTAGILQSSIWRSDAADSADNGTVRFGNGETIAWEANPTGTEGFLSYSVSNLFLFTSPLDAPGYTLNGTNLWGIAAGANITITTNGGQVVIAGSAGGGGGGATNSVNSTNLTQMNLKDTDLIHWSLQSTTNALAQGQTNSTLTDASTIAIDATISTKFSVTLGGNRTLGNPTGARDMQEYLIRIKEDGTGGRTLGLDTKYQPGSAVTTNASGLFNISTNANSVSYIKVIYDSTRDKFDIASVIPGY